MASLVDSTIGRILWMFGFVPESTTESGDQQPTHSDEYVQSPYDYTSSWPQHASYTQSYTPGDHQEMLTLLQRPLSETGYGLGEDTGPETVEDLLSALVEEWMRDESANEYYDEALRQIAQKSDADSETVQQVLQAFVGWMDLFTMTVQRTHGVERETARRAAYALIPYMAQARLGDDDGPNQPETTDTVDSSENESTRTFVPSLRTGVNSVACLVVLGIATGGATGLITVTDTTVTLVVAALSILGGSFVTAQPDQSSPGDTADSS